MEEDSDFLEDCDSCDRPTRKVCDDDNNCKQSPRTPQYSTRKNEEFGNNNTISQKLCTEFNTPLDKSLDGLIIKRSLPPTKRLESSPKSTPVPPTPFLLRRRNFNTCPPLRLNRFPKAKGVRSSNSDPPKAQSVREALLEYVNPFSPDGKVISKTRAQLQFIKQGRGSLELLMGESFQEGDSIEMFNKRTRLNEMNVERFYKEFVQLEELGRGNHGCVFKCLNKLNGCVYAVKKSMKEVESGTYERLIRKEVYAHGILEHNNLVKNYSSWVEDGTVHIQNEYCNLGSLRKITERHTFEEFELYDMIYQIGLGLRYVHEKGLAHMDIKPDNIMIQDNFRVDTVISKKKSYTFDEPLIAPKITYKLGDFGHIVAMGDRNIEDGDCRYLSSEIIQDNYANLDRADIFALGLTIYEIMAEITLPKNGDDWQEMRQGKLKYIEKYSRQLNELLLTMVKPKPTDRPSARELCESVENLKQNKNSSELVSCLININNNLNFLQNKIDLVCDTVKAVSPYSSANKEDRTRRLVGKKTKRSSSTLF